MVRRKIKDGTILNLANALSFLRMFLAPIFALLIFRGMYIRAFIVVLVMTVTDFLDGHVARIWKIQTRFGKMLDPLADKIVVFFAILALLIRFDFPLWIGLIIILRDIVILIGGGVFLHRNKKDVLQPNLFGKITTFFQMLTIVIFVLDSVLFSIDKIIVNMLLYTTAFFTIISAIVYFKKGYILLFRARLMKGARKNWINLANRITTARILLIPFFIWVLMGNLPYKEIFAASLFIILATSDLLDGYIARKRKEVTKIGMFMDPLADKLLIGAALIILMGKGIDAWIVFAIIIREVIITLFRLYVIKKGKHIAASFSGKIKTTVQIIGITAVILNIPYAYWVMIIAVIITIYSGIEYIWLGKDIILKKVKKI